MIPNINYIKKVSYRLFLNAETEGAHIRIQIVPKRNSVWNKRIKIRVSTSKGTVQNKIMKCMVNKRSAWSKDAIIKITQFVDDLIQETEPGFICGLKKRDNYYY